MPLKLKVAPTDEIISLPDAREHLRLKAEGGSPGTHPDDSYVTDLIKMSRIQTEKFVDMSFLTTTWTLFMDTFFDKRHTIWNKRIGARIIEMPRFPLASVTSLKYLDTDAVQQTLVEGTDFIVDTVSCPGQIQEANNTSWPPTFDQVNAIEIEFIAGFTTLDLFKDEYFDLVRANKLAITGHYELRSTVEPAVSLTEVPGFTNIESLLWPNRTMRKGT